MFGPCVKPDFIGVFRAVASLKNAQKIPLFKNRLPGTRGQDPNFAE